MSLKSYFTNQYLFQINTAFVSVEEKLFFFAGIILVLVAIILKIAAVLSPLPVDKKYRQRFYHLFLTVGISEMVWYLCRFENVQFFGSHFVAWLVILIGLIWLAVDLVMMLKNYRKEKGIWEKQQIRLKYLPR